MSARTPEAARDWDAATYHRVATPQQEWASAVLERLAPRDDETVLDAGCGSGLVTLALVERVPRGRVIAVDASGSMVARAREVLDGRAEVLQSDLLELDLREQVDAVFSSAVFHWVADHDRLFGRLHAALRPGGRIVAQCGGAGNIARFRAVSEVVAERPPFAAHLAGWRAPWHFASAQETEGRLRAAGFVEVRCWLEPWEVVPAEPADYLRSVCLGPHVDRLPERLAHAYVDAVLAESGEPLRLDYVRLNISARRPG